MAEVIRLVLITIAFLLIVGAVWYFVSRLIEFFFAEKEIKTMRRDIRSWSELADIVSEIEKGDDLVIHIQGYEISASVEDCSEVKESVSLP